MARDSRGSRVDRIIIHGKCYKASFCEPWGHDSSISVRAMGVEEDFVFIYIGLIKP